MDKGHVLIVDDESDILSSLSDVLQDEGYRVDRADSGEVALQLVRTEAPDVILVDVWMPGIDGIKTLQAVKESNADVEVVMMSGHGNIETAVAATKLGAFNFLEKPLSIDTVLRIIGSAVQARRTREIRASDVVDVILESYGRGMQTVKKGIRRAAKDRGLIVIAGERGTGKRFVARLIHIGGVTKKEEFMPVHCHSLLPLPRRGQWREALERLVPATFKGTVYLDGIEQIPSARRGTVIGRFLEHLGTAARLVVAVDHMGTTEDRNEVQAMSEKTGGATIHVPPLRRRKEDILMLANRFLGEHAESVGDEKEFSEDAAALLQKYDWPGNVAELKGAVTNAAYSSQGMEIGIEDLPFAIRAGSSLESKAPKSEAISRFTEARTQWERQHLSFHLEEHGWNIAQTARAVGMPEKVLKQKIQAYRIEPPLPAPGALGKGSQRSILKSVVERGRGLHSGLRTGLRLAPQPPGSGIQFGNLTTAETVRANVDFVDNTNHATNLRHGEVVARTIEHLMSALHAYKITNILIQIGEEVPVMDGSAVEFCRLLEEAGIEDQKEKREEWQVDRTYEVGEPDSEEGYIRIEPADSLIVSYLIDYPPPIGRQSYRYEHENVLSFQEEIAPARTFAFASELESLEKMGLAEGGRWDNVILVDEGRIVNTELRFPNEFVRHKILDVIGDLYLTGCPIRGKVTAQRSGHRHNVALVKKLVEARG